MPSPARAVAVLVGLLALTATLLAVPAAEATPGTSGTAGATERTTVSKREAHAVRALQRARAALAGQPTGGLDATMALRELIRLKAALSPDDRAAAQKLLGRPSFTNSDCSSATACIHWTLGEVGAGWPELVRNTVTSVGQAFAAAGYRKPKPDGTLGGNSKIDIYVDNLEPGLYGYCTSDQPTASGPNRYDVWAFCVLDNDYSGFPEHTPEENLQVTAAHEFFHAVQYSYDFLDDTWWLEGSAAWVEDELYNDVNDNVQYLNSSPISNPGRSLDKEGGGFHYGSWAFLRWLTERFPQQKGSMPKLILDAWKLSDSSKPAKDHYGTEALAKVLKKRKLTIDKAFALFSDETRRSRTEFREGTAESYPVKRLAGSKTLKNGGQGKLYKARLDHLTSATFRYVPQGLGSKFRLRLNFDMAPKSQGSRAVVTTYKPSGKAKAKYVKVNGKGKASLKVPFSSRKVDAIEVTLVNASVRFDRCYQAYTPFSCSGRPEDQKVRSSVRGTVFKS